MPFDIRQTKAFETWLDGLTDARAQRLIASRLDRLAFGHWGDASPVGDKVTELRIHYGPGFRVYVTERAGRVVVVLGAGDKGTQGRDIKAARQAAKELDG